MSPLDRIAAGIDAALNRQDTATVVALFERRHRMIADLFSEKRADPAPRSLLEGLIEQDRTWMRRSRDIRDAIKAELNDYEGTRQSSLHIGQAYGALTSSAGRFVSSRG
jgi:hypothetical protein